MGYLLHLAKYVPYNISVRAATSAGNGTEVIETAFTEEGGISWIVICMLSLSLPLSLSLSPAPPVVQGVIATRINNTAIRVSWEPLTLVNAKGFIKNYTIILTPVSSRKRQASPRMMTVPANQSSVLFTGLQSNTAYRISVHATTGGGQGESNSTIPTIPPVPTATTGNTKC